MASAPARQPHRSGWTHPDSSAERFDDGGAVGRRQAFKIGRVSRKDEASARFGGDRDHVRINDVRGPSFGSMEHRADKPRQCPVGVPRLDRGSVACEQRVDGLSAGRTAIGLGQYERGDEDVPTTARSSFEGPPNLALSRRVGSGECVQPLVVQGHDHDSRTRRYRSISASSSAVSGPSASSSWFRSSRRARWRRRRWTSARMALFTCAERASSGACSSSSTRSASRLRETLRFDGIRSSYQSRTRVG